MSKKYGLVLPEKGNVKQPTFEAKRNVFGDDSDSDDGNRKTHGLLVSSDKINRKAKITQEKAVMEDPTVYQYDELYDSMVSKKDEIQSKKKEEKKPKYIEQLMKSAKKRKIENERRIERQIQKERENEGDEFADKEVFVTSAYKKKLEEMKQEEENEKREEYLENIGDVTKQEDLGGFYRHLYEQKLGTSKKVKEEVNNESSPVKNLKTDQENTKSKKRNYRKRKSSTDAKNQLSDGEIEDSEEEINRVNLEDIKKAKLSVPDENIDADSDFSIDESSDEEDNKNNEKEKRSSEEVFKKPTDVLPPKSKSSNKDTDKPDTNKSSIESDTLADIKEKVVTEVKAKIYIWKKRTVGVVFDEALKRYYERKAARGS